MTTHDTGQFRSWEERYVYFKLEFERTQSQAFAVLEAGGVHPDKTDPIENPYNGEMDSEDFSNVGEHCIAVGICADRIASEMAKSGVLDDLEKNSITERALIHDANKRYEVFRKKAGQGASGYTKEVYEAIQDKLPESVRANTKMVDYMVHAGNETGHTSMEQFVRLNDSGEIELNPDRSYAEMIVHLADDMTASPLKHFKTGKLLTKNDKTVLCTVKERMDLCKFEERYPFLYQEGFGFDENGEPTLVKDAQELEAGGETLKETKTYAEWQEIVARMICEKLVSIIKPDFTGDAEEFIKKLVNQSS